MSEVSFHLRDDFFEEILNGIPKEDLNKILKKDEKNNKLVLSGDSKRRVKNTAIAFYESEESRKIFISIIKDAKEKQKQKYIRNIDFKFLHIVFEEEEERDEEDEVSEDLAENDGILSKFKDIREKYKTIQKWKERKKSFNKLIAKLKDAYKFLSGITAASLFNSRSKVTRLMNKHMLSLFNSSKEALILPAIGSSKYSLFAFTNIITKEIKSKINTYFDFLEEIMEIILTKELFYILRSMPGIGVIAARAQQVYENTYLRYSKANKFFEIMSDPVKRKMIFGTVHALGSVGFLAFTGHLMGSDAQLINDFSKKIIGGLQSKGDDIIRNISNKSESIVGDLASDFGLDTAINNIGFFANEGKKILSDKISQLDNILSDDLDVKMSIDDKFEIAYRLISNAYTKSIQLSPWTQTIRYLEKVVSFSQNLFNPFLDGLNRIIQENDNFMTTSGGVLDVDNYLKKIVENGIDFKTTDGKLHLLRNKKGKNNSSKEEIKNDIFSITVLTKQSTENKISSEYIKNGKKPSEVSITSNIYSKRKTPFIKINFGENGRNYMNDNFNVISCYKSRHFSNNVIEKEWSETSKTAFDKKSITNYILNEKNINKKWLNEINEDQKSPLGHFFHHLFSPYDIGTNVGNINFYLDNNSIGKTYDDSLYFKYYGKYFDNTESFSMPYPKYKTENNKKVFDRYGKTSKTNFDKSYVTLTGGESSIDWITILNAEIFMESFMLSRFERIRDNNSETYTNLKYDLNLETLRFK